MKLKELIRVLLCLLLVFTLVILSACEQIPPQDEDDDGIVDDGEADGDGDGEEDEDGENFLPPDGFLPVLRFAISSDIHVRSTTNDYGSAKKLERFIGSAYEYAETQKWYDSLDGIFIVGDLTQDGKSAEYGVAVDMFMRMVDYPTVIRVAMGNHEMHAYGKGDDRFTSENIAKSTKLFNSKLGYKSEDMHEVIGGYHFIILANDTYESGNYYNDEALAWLETEIEAAMADDASADKPIFVMQHEPPKGDVRGFVGGDTGLGELLKKYPRVVDFSGHTHRSILDPQSIWQDGFTAIGTGGLAYLGYNMAGHPTLDDKAITALDMDGDYLGGGSNGARTGAMYYIVEVDAGNNIRLKIYDLVTESIYGEPITFRVGEGEPEVFTPDREEKSAAPVFPENAKIEVISTDYNLPEIKFTTPTGGDLTQYYKISLTKDGESEPSLVFYRLGCMHYAAKGMSEHITPIRGHSESGKYIVEIRAYNCWGKESLPLLGEITIAERTMTPDILETVFNTDGTAANGGALLPVTNAPGGVGAPAVSFDPMLGRNIASFDGASGYKFSGISDYYDDICHSLSMEILFRPGETDAAMSIGSNTDSAGFGISRAADGSLSFSFRYNNGASRYLTAKTAPGVAPVGEWTHAVVSLSTRGSIRIFVNGEEVTLYDADGAEIGKALSSSGILFQAPTGAAAAFIIGGDIDKSGLVESGFIGDIAAMNIFSRPLTESEAAELYSSYFEADE